MQEFPKVKVKNRFILSLWHLLMSVWTLFEPNWTRRLLQHYADGEQARIDRIISNKLDR